MNSLNQITAECNVATAAPLFFKSEGIPLFAWHHSSGGTGTAGLVICNPFGYEAVCAHRTLQTIAVRAAAAGVPSIRFDYRGTGDSAGRIESPDPIRAWVEDIRAAADQLKKMSGVRRMVLLGIRLGGTLATLAAGGRDDVAGLVTIEPVINGRSYLRELGLLQAAFAATAPEFVDASDSNEVLGFPMPETLRSTLATLDLRKLPSTSAAPALVFAREGFKDGQRWGEHLKSLGVTVATRRAYGYTEMLLDPHQTIVPDTMIKESVDWMTGLPDDGKPIIDHRRIESPAHSHQRKPDVRDTCPSVSIDGVVEQAQRFGSTESLFAIVTKPAAASPKTCASILLLNAGATHHIGPNRLYVTWARRWASRGHTVMRMDVSGIGDSPENHGRAGNIVYSPEACKDALTAIDHLRSLSPETPVILMGLCSGAFHAMQAASENPKIAAIVMINPLTYFWDYGKGTGIGDLALSKQASRVSGAKPSSQLTFSKLLDAARWQRGIKFLTARGLQSASATAREVMRRIGVAVSHDPHAVLQSLLKSGVKVQLIFSRGDPGLDLLHVQGGKGIARLARRGELKLNLIDDADHTFTLIRKQNELSALLDSIIDAFDAPAMQTKARR